MSPEESKSSYLSLSRNRSRRLTIQTQTDWNDRSSSRRRAFETSKDGSRGRKMQLQTAAISCIRLGSKAWLSKNLQTPLDVMRSEGLMVCVYWCAHKQLLHAPTAAGLKLSAHLRKRHVLFNPLCLPLIASVFTTLIGIRPRSSGCCIHYSAHRCASSRAALSEFALNLAKNVAFLLLFMMNTKPEHSYEEREQFWWGLKRLIRL